MVINYEPLNAIIVKFRYFMPHEDNLLQHLIRNMIYSKVDCKSSSPNQDFCKRYPKQTFNTQIEQFEWLVMPLEFVMHELISNDWWIVFSTLIILPFLYI